RTRPYPPRPTRPLAIRLSESNSGVACRLGPGESSGTNPESGIFTMNKGCPSQDLSPLPPSPFPPFPTAPFPVLPLAVLPLPVLLSAVLPLVVLPVGVLPLAVLPLAVLPV